jgi:hypothetical protein
MLEEQRLVSFSLLQSVHSGSSSNSTSCGADNKCTLSAYTADKEGRSNTDCIQDTDCGPLGEMIASKADIRRLLRTKVSVYGKPVQLPLQA